LNTFNVTCVVKGLAVVALAAAYSAVASETPLSVNALTDAVKHGRCDHAVKLIKTDVTANDRQSAFLTGRLLDEGVCVKPDPQNAAHFFAQAAELGDRNGALDFAAKVGLGEGVEQDYQRAGALCRAAGVDPQKRLTDYSLGYACTVRGVVGKHLRQTLPTAAFKPTAGAVALVEFIPSTGELRVRTTPHVAPAEAPTGSMLSHPMVNAQKEIDRAWRDALADVPKPDVARLDNQAVELSVDVDMTLEVVRNSSQELELQKPLFKGDIHGTTTGQMME
jgi:hypothetical protein